MNEPVAIAHAIKESISSFIKVLVVFGLILVDEVQLAVLLLFVDNFLALAVAIWSRMKSTPTANPSLKAGTVGKIEGTEDTFVVPGESG
jgi:hypothetical protein